MVGPSGWQPPLRREAIMREETRRIGTEGVIAGIIGYAAIVLFFAAWNTIAGRSPFHTAAMLGTVLTGSAPPSVANIDAGSVLAWNGLHLVVFLLLGVISATVVRSVERSPRALWGAFLLGIFGFILLMYMMYAFSERQGWFLPFWLIAVAMLLATSGMTAYLLRAHPQLRREIQHLDEIEEAEARA
jgi:peptidoglycan/LPS O-acetylase OafA/YrhL